MGCYRLLVPRGRLRLQALHGIDNELGAPGNPIARRVEDQVVVARVGCIFEKVIPDEGVALLVKGFELARRLFLRNTVPLADGCDAVFQRRHQVNTQGALGGQDKPGGPANDNALAVRSESENRLHQTVNVGALT